MKPYTISRTPELYHGEGSLKTIGSLLASYSKSALLVTGGRSFESSAAYSIIVDELVRRKFAVHHIKIGREPSPAMIDSAVASFVGHSPEVVIGLGGGSVLDAAKAMAAMIPIGEPVANYLEGVGTRQHPGLRLPLIALPTTSGTGSEATRNAVISEVGEQGFKRSLRHLNFVADAAILDPALTLHCPPDVTAYSGMDAFTQLLEAYLSIAASPITDALAWQGLKLVAQSLTIAYHDGMNLQARSDMALAAYLSGITLANAGLGTVHGMAGIIGGLKNIPHGVICSRLMGPANAITVRRLQNSNDGAAALAKYASIGKLFTSVSHQGDSYYVDALIDIINTWTYDMHIPRLNQYDVTDKDLRRFAQLSDNKNNPVQLNEDERYEVLRLASK